MLVSFLPATWLDRPTCRLKALALVLWKDRHAMRAPADCHSSDPPPPPSTTGTRPGCLRVLPSDDRTLHESHDPGRPLLAGPPVLAHLLDVTVVPSRGRVADDEAPEAAVAAGQTTHPARSATKGRVEWDSLTLERYVN